ncbi:thioredoxin domain-containing protein [Bacillus atrophaeus]|nr:DUF255 domain-containing protein [Bacillus atrophaeus]MDS9995437.1 thioredoxin domain-containing protein [Bacillus atrophaeus]
MKILKEEGDPIPTNPIQHTHNPVNWFPWGEEAFEKAKRENKPVLVSIGYSTCHWRLSISCLYQVHNNFTPLQKTLRTVCQ